MKECILSLDQGTTGSRALIFDAKGAVVSVAQREINQSNPRPGWVEHDPEEIWYSQWAVALEAVKNAGVTGREIVGIGITNQRETTLMIAKESVRARMTERETGISYTEFSYMLIQAYDFHHLRRELNCELQIGGSDQWGNITAGIELCRKKLSAQVWGLTLPLITNADGSKFGKSVAGAIWLDRAKTSVYRFYQYFIQTDDRDVIRFLKFFTFLSKAEIEDLARLHAERPEGREAHQALAREMTTLVHGEQATRDAIGASSILFGGGLEDISEQSFKEVVAEAPVHAIAPEEIAGDGAPLADLLTRSGLSPSKGQARKEIPQGGIYINNVRETDIQRRLTSRDLLFEKFILLRKGKRNYLVLTLA